MVGSGLKGKEDVDNRKGVCRKGVSVKKGRGKKKK